MLPEKDLLAELTKTLEGNGMVNKALLEALTGEKYEGEKQATTNTATLLFGSGGIFSVPGSEPDVVTAHVRPKGISPMLPKFGSTLEQPLYSILTGYTDTEGAEVDDPCDDAPAGFTKSGQLTAQFGRLQRATQTIEFDKVMLKVNAGVTTDLQLRGRLLGIEDFNPSGLDESAVLNIVTMGEMVGVGVQMERVLSRHMWQGSPANNSAGGGYKEFPGLDSQIATGQVDATTGQPIPAADSDVKDFGLNQVGGSAPSIVEQLSMLEFYLRYNAERMGLDPVTWVIAMRPELWYELSAIWPCQYNTNRCADAIIGGGSRVFIDGRENVAERDRMRRGKTIDINGNTFQVVTDTGIFEHNSTNNAGLIPGQYASSIYMVPLMVTGNWPVTYMEHVDYRAGARDMALLRNRQDFWTDRGMFSWALSDEKWCYKLDAKTEMRVVLRTPHLAGRIDNVAYEPAQHLRSPYPDSPYFFDGGLSVRETEPLNAVWN